MVIGIFGESCVGKSTLAQAVAKRLGAKVYSGKDYLRLSKNEAEAARLFREELAGAEGAIVYVASEKEQLSLLPEGCKRVLVTAELDTIKQRFAARMGGKLPPPVAQMLERKHGLIDGETCDLRIDSGEQIADDA